MGFWVAGASEPRIDRAHESCRLCHPAACGRVDKPHARFAGRSLVQDGQTPAQNGACMRPCQLDRAPNTSTTSLAGHLCATKRQMDGWTARPTWFSSLTRLTRAAASRPGRLSVRRWPSLRSGTRLMDSSLAARQSRRRTPLPRQPMARPTAPGSPRGAVHRSTRWGLGWMAV
jgi:hypothetical protein